MPGRGGPTRRASRLGHRVPRREPAVGRGDRLRDRCGRGPDLRADGQRPLHGRLAAEAVEPARRVRIPGDAALHPGGRPDEPGRAGIGADRLLDVAAGAAEGRAGARQRADERVLRRGVGLGRLGRGGAGQRAGAADAQAGLQPGLRCRDHRSILDHRADHPALLDPHLLRRADGDVGHGALRRGHPARPPARGCPDGDERLLRLARRPSRRPGTTCCPLSAGPSCAPCRR